MILLACRLFCAVQPSSLERPAPTEWHVNSLARTDAQNGNAMADRNLQSISADSWAWVNGGQSQRSGGTKWAVRGVVLKLSAFRCSSSS